MTVKRALRHLRAAERALARTSDQLAAARDALPESERGRVDALRYALDDGNYDMAAELSALIVALSENRS